MKASETTGSSIGIAGGILDRFSDRNGCPPAHIESNPALSAACDKRAILFEEFVPPLIPPIPNFKLAPFYFTELE
jgi:hypothetical protein